MQTLANLLTATPASSADAAGERASVPDSFDHEESPFQDVMSQAMGTAGTPAAAAKPAAGSAEDATPADVTDATSFDAANATSADAANAFASAVMARHQAGQMLSPAALVTAAPPAPVLNLVQNTGGEKTGSKVSPKKSASDGDSSTKSSPGNAPLDVTLQLDNAQNLPIQLLAPALSSYLVTTARGSGGTAGATGATGSLGNVLAALSTGISAKLSAAGKEVSTAAVSSAMSSRAGAEVETAKSPAAGTGANTAGLNSSGEAAEAAPGKLIVPAGPATAPVRKKEYSTAAVASALNAGPAPAKTAEAAAAAATSAKVAGTDLPPATAGSTPDTTETPANADGADNPAALGPVQVHGTLAAKQEVPMKNAENTIKVAGQGEKVLPGDLTSSGRANNLTARAASTTVAAPRNGASGANIIPLSAAPEHSVENASSGNTTSVSSLSDIRSRALDRTQEMVAQHAVRLVGSSADSLSVVINPGAGMQLSLQLKQGASGVEAQAVLQQGDYENLKQHWPDLQNRLEQRGIKLAPLGSDENAMSFANQNRGQQSRQQPEETALMASAFAEFSLAGPMTAVPAQPALAALSGGGWQTWA